MRALLVDEDEDGLHANPWMDDLEPAVGTDGVTASAGVGEGADGRAGGQGLGALSPLSGDNSSGFGSPTARVDDLDGLSQAQQAQPSIEVEDPADLLSVFAPPPAACDVDAAVAALMGIHLPEYAARRSAALRVGGFGADGQALQMSSNPMHTHRTGKKLTALDAEHLLAAAHPAVSARSRSAHAGASGVAGDELRNGTGFPVLAPYKQYPWLALALEPSTAMLLESSHERHQATLTQGPGHADGHRTFAALAAGVLSQV